MRIEQKTPPNSPHNPIAAHIRDTQTSSLSPPPPPPPSPPAPPPHPSKQSNPKKKKHAAKMSDNNDLAAQLAESQRQLAEAREQLVEIDRINRQIWESYVKFAEESVANASLRRLEAVGFAAQTFVWGMAVVVAATAAKSLLRRWV
jgi:hypothetical protein